MVFKSVVRHFLMWASRKNKCLAVDKKDRSRPADRQGEIISKVNPTGTRTRSKALDPRTTMKLSLVTTIQLPRIWRYRSGILLPTIA